MAKYYMLSYPSIDPVALDLGVVQIHWYGVMYLLAFLGAWGLALHMSRRPWSVLKPGQVEDLILYGAFGVILGGRCGYVLFYHFDRFLLEPLWLFKITEGGMSFHGGAIGVGVAMLVYARKLKIPFFRLMDFVVPLVPIGLGFGRIGNFIGQELWGRATTPDMPFAMQFPADPLQLWRHPSQLYEAFFEGAVLFAILYWFARRPRPAGSVMGMFLLFYGIFRFGVEFVREPDSHLRDELLFGWMTRGQTLCVPMVAAGIGLVAWGFWRTRKESEVKAES